jgi:hypothetical protein
LGWTGGLAGGDRFSGTARKALPSRFTTWRTFKAA